ncbi:type II secretion system protein [Halostella sp. JP-L12]|uniref:type II secretion system protein n=1 Tax=Halostella TaxID=1843185 RepID=UPI000EF85218|nr:MULTISPECIES: type II secretion system protein [Halostella]NHN47446.1 type II secretion system protein [Halostella sp. JP-L12]
MLTAILGTLARCSPIDADPDADLRRSLGFLDAEVSPETVATAGYGAAGVVAALAVPVIVLVPGRWFRTTLLAAVAAALVAAHALRRGPVVLARARRTAALGDAPGLVARAVLRMQIEPAVETAAGFAARTGRGPLAESLDGHVRRADGTPRSGLAGFADEWDAWFPAITRATHLIAAAAAAPSGERSRTLDRALTAALDGTRDRMAAFASDVHAPATGLYAFGVLLPLALVAVVPAAGVAGAPVTLPLFVFAYDAVLPLGLVSGSAWLLLRRPVAFPPPAVSRSHPDVPDRRWPPVAIGGAAGALAAAGSALLLPVWTAWVAGVGVGVGATLVRWYRPIVEVRERVRSVEEGLVDALYLVGRRVAEGEAVESAVERAAEEVGGATGEVLTAASRRGRQLGVGVRESFLGEYGALADVPSPRTRSTAALLAIAAVEGRPAGRAVVAMADHVEELQTVEREAQRELARVTGTLRSTASAFGPLVAGTTVALAGGIGGADLGGSALPVPGLGLAVGAYVLLLAVVLAALSAGLEHGLDRAVVGYRAGRALCSATLVYLVAFAAGGALVNV